MKSAQQVLQAAEGFIWRSGRLLERRLYAFLFGSGTGEQVLSALRPYQNDDGGFGNALEPDIRCPHSQPVPTEQALYVMDVTGLYDGMASRACDWLLSVATPEGGVPWLLPSALDYPRAPWWETDLNPPASVNPTAGVAGLLHKHGVRHPFTALATNYTWGQIEQGTAKELHEVYELTRFLEHVPDRVRAERAFKAVGESIFAHNLVLLDPGASGYGKKVLEWAPTPRSLCRQLFTEEQVNAHLDALMAAQQEDGGWPITWPAVSPAGEQEWRGMRTIDALRTLKAYGRLN